MNKREFEKFILRNLDEIKSIRCDIIEGFDLDNKDGCWVDVSIEGYEFISIYTSDYFSLDSKEVIKLRYKWKKKLETWINPNWGIPLVCERYTV